MHSKLRIFMYTFLQIIEMDFIDAPQSYVDWIPETVMYELITANKYFAIKYVIIIHNLKPEFFISIAGIEEHLHIHIVIF